MPTHRCMKKYIDNDSWKIPVFTKITLKYIRKYRTNTTTLYNSIETHAKLFLNQETYEQS